MMTCDECLEKLHDFLGQEMTPDVLTPLQKHLDDCPPCLDRFDFSRKLRSLVQKTGAHQAVPEGLQARIRGEIGKVLPVRPKVKALPMNRGQSILGLVASLVVAAGLATGLVMVRGTQPPAEMAADSPMLAALAEDHVNCSSMQCPKTGLSVEEAQSELSSELGYPVHLPHLPASCHGLSVRVCQVDGISVGHVIMHRAGHVFSWFVFDTRKTPSDEHLDTADQPRTVASEALLWRVHDDQTDCLVSDQPGDVKSLAMDVGFLH